MATIHNRLVEVREDAGLSQHQLAARVKAVDGFDRITHTTVRNYELGKAEGGTEKVPSDYVAVVCKLFGLRVEWLVLGEEPKLLVPTDEEANGFRRIAAIVDEVRKPTRSAEDAADRGVGALKDLPPGAEPEKTDEEEDATEGEAS